MTRYHNTDGVLVPFTPEEEVAYEAEVEASKALSAGSRVVEVKAQRQAAYVNESDALFFSWQAGEKNKQDWLDARDAIKTRFPKGA